MYEKFYGFTTYPFALTPDTQFLYPRENYKDCLFYLLHGLERGYGLLVVTGEIGTGKTFLLNTLIKETDEKTHAAFIENTKLNSFEILQYASKELRLEITGQSKAELLFNLKGFLSTCAMKNEKVVLMVDEAQNLSVDVLEDLRLLTNFENARKKSLQIILVGQPQLEEKLKLPELAQLSQRVGLSCRLLPMNYDETKCYIEKRLSVAGVMYPLFTSRAIKEIFGYSKGIPRVINMICDFALLLGFIAETHEISHTIIKQVMEELNLHTSKKFMHRYTRQKQDTIMAHGNGFMRLKRWAWVGALAAFILLGAGIILQNSPWSEKLKEYTTRSVQSPPVVLPQSPASREPPLLPQSPASREPPLLPQSPASREPSPSLR
jgi:general secretion pathway protein A